MDAPATILSKALYEPWDKPIPGGDENKDPAESSRDDIKFAYCMEALDDLCQLRDFHRQMIQAGLDVLNGGTREGLKPEHVLRFAQASARSLPNVIERRRKIAAECAEVACRKDIRARFLEDRAHAVVHNTLLHLSEEFRDAGFASFMPFRYPDQWLMFCGVMRRVLAANGLIHAKDPDVYRRLLEETPYVETAPEDVRTPSSWGLCESAREVGSLAELRSRLKAKEDMREHLKAVQKQEAG
jgi:hypothetical protein